MKKRGIFLNKKAQGDIESYFVIIKLILAIAAISAMSVYVYSIVSDTFFDKLYFSRDIAFTTNTLYSAPGNVYQEYEREGLDKFEIDFYEQKVQMKEEDIKKKGLSFDYFYGTNLDYIFKKDIIKDSNKIVFQKIPNIFEISPELDKKLNLLKCPDINTIDSEWKQKLFLIDPGYSYNEEEKLIMGSIGFSLYNKFENKDTTIENIEDIKEQVKKNYKKIKELMEESDTTISIRMGNYLGDNNNIKVYISSIGDEELVKKRRRFGCLILNELFSDKKLDNIFRGGNVVSINPEHIKMDYGEMLNNDKISIVIEIGNIQSEKIKDLQNVGIITKIADQIYNGVREYYE
jgi:hypothetical protein